LNQFVDRGGVVSLASPFFVFGYGLRKIKIEENPELLYLIRASNGFESIFNRLWNISIIFDRVAWKKNACLNGNIEKERASKYFKVDIVTYHTETRSILDFATEIIGVFFKQHGQFPTSFNKLRQRIEKYHNKLNNEAIEAIRTANWFDDIRAVRDELIHSHGQVFTPLNTDDFVSFQVHDKLMKRMVNKRVFSTNQNLVSFEKYSAYYTACILVLLAKLGTIFMNLEIKDLITNQLYIQGSGLPVIHHWMTCFQRELQNNT
jgi:hypothetical protein